MPSPCGLAIPSFLKRWGSKKFSGCPRAASRRWQYAHQGFAGFKAVILRGGLCPGGTISHTGVLPVFAFQPCEARCMKHVPRGLRTDQLGTACESRLTAEAFRPARPRTRWHAAPGDPGGTIRTLRASLAFRFQSREAPRGYHCRYYHYLWSAFAQSGHRPWLPLSIEGIYWNRKKWNLIQTEN